MSNHKLHRGADNVNSKQMWGFFKEWRSFVSRVYFWLGFLFVFNIYLFFSIIITAVCNQAVTLRCMLSPKHLGLD